MPYPTIVFNADTGSDTQASGAPSTLGPYFGNNANTTAGSVTVDLSTDNPDLSLVPIDGSAAIFINTSSGDKFFRITGKDTNLKTVTVSVAPSVTGTFAWAIGGKRRTLSGSSYAAGRSEPFWTLLLETDQTLTAGLPIGIHTQLKGDRTTPPLRTISWGYNGYALYIGGSTGHYGIIENLRFINTYSSKTTSIQAIQKSSGPLEVKNCIFGDSVASNRISYGIYGYLANTIVIDCIFQYCVYDGIYYPDLNGSDLVYCVNTVFANNSRYGVSLIFDSPYEPQLVFEDCVFYNNQIGIYDKTSTGYNNLYGKCHYFLARNVFCQNRSHGIHFDTVTNNKWVGTHFVHSNIFYQNGGYGINGVGLNDTFTDSKKRLIDHNCYWQNTSGATLNYPIGPNDVFVDPQFANPANLDFRVGPNLKAKGWPKFDQPIGAGQTNTYAFIDIGAAQRKEPVTKHARTIFIPSL